MSEVQFILERLKSEWSTPKMANHAGKPVAVPLGCSFECPSTEERLKAVMNIVSLPQSLLDFWRSNDGASLFEDHEYGQWGLRIFTTLDSISKTANFMTERPAECRSGDLVIGEFLGDSDQLIIRCDRTLPDYGSVLVALPLDARDVWDVAAASLETFLTTYASTHGEKFWRGARNRT